MTPPMQPCERCGGSGRTPRLRRRRDDGSPDPCDLVGRHRQICDRCGGSGEVRADPPPTAVERGRAADLE
jgi:DnaJ-class molecular chaperone